MSVVGRVLRIQRGEGRTVGLVAGCMFVSVAGLTIGESGASALFFERVGPDALPVMYLVQGGVGVAAMLVLSGALGRFERRRAYVWMPVLLVAVVALERVVVATDPAWIYPVLYVTTSIGTLLQAVYLWGAAGLVTDTRRAKRLFPIFSAGNILGSVAGGIVTPPLAAAIGAENLLVVWAAALLATSALTTVIVGVRRGVRPRGPMRRAGALHELVEGFRAVRRSALLVWMSVGSVLFSVLFYSLYLPYAQAATARYPDPDALAGFFGVFWASVTAVAFLVSVLLTNRLLGWFGAAAVVIVLPVLYGGAFGILLVTSTFATLVAIRFAVNVWLQGVSSPAWETLTNVAPAERLDQIRAFMNGGPSQVGTAIAGVIAIVGQDVLSARQLAGIGLVTAVLTGVATLRMRRSYSAALADAIRSGRPSVFEEPVRGTPVEIRQDAQAVALAASALDDDDPRVRRLAVHLLGTIEDEAARAALARVARDPDAGVRAAAITGLDRTGGAPEDVVASALGDEDPDVRAAAARSAATDPSAVRDPDPRVAAVAAIRCLTTDRHDEAAARIRDLLGGDVDARLAVLGEIAAEGPPRAAAFVGEALEDPSPVVRAAALDAATGTDPDVARLAALDALSSGDDVLVASALRFFDTVGLGGIADDVRRLMDERLSVAATDGDLATLIAPTDDARALLRDALVARARHEALTGLAAASLTVDDPGPMRLAGKVLQAADRAQLANALEAVEVALGTGRARSIVSLWEVSAHGRPAADAVDPAASADAAAPAPVDTAATHADPFVRACAELVRVRDVEGGKMGRAVASMSPIERVIILRRIELFAALEPADLERVAQIAEERAFTDADVIGAEGELGDELHIVLEGTVRVDRVGTTIATRREGDVIGEMSLITGSSRVASLIAEGDVRTVRIGRREFEAMVRERPEIALAVMRVLADRLAAASAAPG